MKNVVFITLFLLLLSFSNACSFKKKEKNHVLIETDYGNIKIKLYEETPLHKENFIKLIESEFYNDLLFHRVIKDFVIQGGDSDFQSNFKNTETDSPEYEYTIPSEIIYPAYFHKKGALAAARTPTEFNPKKESSASQFYIVQGRIYSEEELSFIEEDVYTRKLQQELKQLFAVNGVKIQEYLDENQAEEEIRKLEQEILTQAENLVDSDSSYLFTPEQKRIYTTIGGAPFLDGEYTVFGEVVEGMDVVELISNVKTDEQDRPEKDIKMKISLVE